MSRRLVLIYAAVNEGFFADMAAGQFATPEDMSAIVESGDRHNMIFTGPPLD